MIRQAEAHEIGAAQEILRTAFTPFIAIIGQKPAPMQIDLAAAQAAGQLWLAEEGQIIAALMVCRAKAEALELEILAVAPDAQGQGLGMAMVCHAEAVARGANLGAVTLCTNVAMTGAQRLYARLGFELIERRQQDGFDRLFYRKALIDCSSPASPASS